MDFPLDVPGFTEYELWIKAPPAPIGLSPKLMQGGDRAPRGESSLERIVIDDDGNELIATMEPRSFGLDLPAVEVNGETYEPTPALPFPEITAALAPLILTIPGGISGLIMGIAAVFIDFPILRSGRPTWQRLGMVFIVFLLAAAGTQVLSGILASR